MENKELKTIRIDKNVHKQLKIYCSINDYSITEMVEKLILDLVKKK